MTTVNTVQIKVIEMMVRYRRVFVLMVDWSTINSTQRVARSPKSGTATRSFPREQSN